MHKIKKIFNSKNLKVALIATTGQTGSDYLNCCLVNYTKYRCHLNPLYGDTSSSLYNIIAN